MALQGQRNYLHRPCTGRLAQSALWHFHVPVCWPNARLALRPKIFTRCLISALWFTWDMGNYVNYGSIYLAYLMWPMPTLLLDAYIKMHGTNKWPTSLLQQQGKCSNWPSKDDQHAEMENMFLPTNHPFGCRLHLCKRFMCWRKQASKHPKTAPWCGETVPIVGSGPKSVLVVLLITFHWGWSPFHARQEVAALSLTFVSHLFNAVNMDLFTWIIMWIRQDTYSCLIWTLIFFNVALV